MKNISKTSRISTMKPISRRDLGRVVGGHLIATSEIELPDGRTQTKKVYRTDGGGREVVVTVE